MRSLTFMKEQYESESESDSDTQGELSGTQQPLISPFRRIPTEINVVMEPNDLTVEHVPEDDSEEDPPPSPSKTDTRNPAPVETFRGNIPVTINSTSNSVSGSTSCSGGTSTSASNDGNSSRKSICSLTKRMYKCPPPDITFLWIFPEELEATLNKFDGPIIDLCQQPRARFLFYLSHLLTGMVAIEYLIVMPLFCFIVGEDQLAIESLYIAMLLVFLSQILKRFVWRYRPFMGHRALELQSCRTSSFPSRAVTCSLVYCYLAVLVINRFTDLHDPLWILPIFLVFPLLVSLSRIHLGVHYPTDCIGGMILGLVVSALSKTLFIADYHICGCHNSLICYPTIDTTVQNITFNDLIKSVNWYVLAGSVVGQFLFALMCVMKPIKFWVKFGAIFGLLFPALTFKMVFLCPMNPIRSAVSPSPFNYPSLGYGLGVIGFGMVVGMKLQKKLLFWIFSIYWIFYLAALVVWRLYIHPLLLVKL